MIETLMTARLQAINAHSPHPLLPGTTFPIPASDDSAVMIPTVSEYLTHGVSDVLILTSPPAHLLGNLVHGAHDVETFQYVFMLEEALKERDDILLHQKDVGGEIRCEKLHEQWQVVT
jgi:hypothetical protein